MAQGKPQGKTSTKRAPLSHATPASHLSYSLLSTRASLVSSLTMARITDLPTELLIKIFRHAIFHPNTLDLRLIDYRPVRSLIAVNSLFCEVSVHLASSMNSSIVARRYWRVAESILRDRERRAEQRCLVGPYLENRSVSKYRETATSLYLSLSLSLSPLLLLG